MHLAIYESGSNVFNGNCEGHPCPLAMSVIPCPHVDKSSVWSYFACILTFALPSGGTALPLTIIERPLSVASLSVLSCSCVIIPPCAIANASLPRISLLTGSTSVVR